MKKNNFIYIFIFLMFSVITLGLANYSLIVKQPHSTIEILSTDEISDDPNAEKSFDMMMDVLMHKRCVNCHPAGDTPLQGEDSHLHNFGIVRGEDGHGLAGYTCGTCHQEENNKISGVPGAPEWAVAPAEMVWEGKSRVEIATQMMDPARNGGRTPEEIEKHLTEHELVLWAWEPGIDAEGMPREKPPVPVDEYITAVKNWIHAGAVIPAQ